MENRETRISNSKNIGTWLIFANLCIVLFCVYSKNETTPYIDIPHFELNTLPIYLVLTLSVLSFIFVALYYRFVSVDIVAKILIIRLAIHLIPFLYSDMSKHFGVNFVTSILCVFFYLMGLNFSDNKELVGKVFRLVFWIIAIQTVFEFLMSGSSFMGTAQSILYAYKNGLAIPIGSSNAIVTRILPCFVLIMSMNKNKRKAILYTIVFAIVVVITKSRTGMLVAVIMTAFLIVRKKEISIKRIIPIIFSLIALLIGFYFFISRTDIGKAAFSLGTNTLDSRLNLWGSSLRIFLSHPLFGAGFTQSVTDADPHNFLLSILARSGIVGGLIFVSLFRIFLRRIKEYKYDEYVMGCAFFVSGILLQSLMEVAMFNYIEDMMMWFILGSLSSRIKDLNFENYGM